MPMSPRLLRPRASSGFDPRSIADLGLWLDATVASSWTLQTGVSEWRDLSGNGRHYSQSVANNQPTLTDLAGNPAQINGRQAFYTDGVNDELVGNAATAGMLRNLAGVTVFMVTNYNVANANSGDVISFFGGGATFLLNPGSYMAVARGGTDNFVNRGGTPAASTTRVTAMEWNVAQNTVQAWNNGSRFINAAGSTAGTISDSDVTNRGLFRLYAQQHRAFTSEILIYRRVLTTAERQAVEAYLTRKYIP